MGDKMANKSCKHLSINIEENNVLCMLCQNKELSRERTKTTYGEAYDEENLQVNVSSKSKIYTLIIFATIILLIAALYANSLALTKEEIDMLILKKKIKSSQEFVYLQNIQVFGAIVLSLGGIVGGVSCFSTDYSNKVRGWMMLGMEFLFVSTLNLSLISNQWIHRYQ